MERAKAASRSLRRLAEAEAADSRMCCPHSKARFHRHLRFKRRFRQLHLFIHRCCPSQVSILILLFIRICLTTGLATRAPTLRRPVPAMEQAMASGQGRAQALVRAMVRVSVRATGGTWEAATPTMVAEDAVAGQATMGMITPTVSSIRRM